MEFVFLELFNASISASWFVLAILLLRPLLKKVPKWVNPILWCLVMVRLIMPISIESPVSFVPSVETISPTILYEKIPSIESGIPVINNTVNTAIENTMTANTEHSVYMLHRIISIVSIIWIIGMIGMLLYAGISYCQLKQKMKTAVKLRDNIYRSECITIPFVLGISCPCIYVPFSMEESALEYVIAHEKAHMIRRDHWIKPIAFVILSVYWFHPLLWVAYYFLCKDIELACDERVIAKLEPIQRATYSKILCSYGGNQSMKKKIVNCPLAFGEVGVKERVKHVLSYKKPTFWILIVAILSCMIMGVFFLTNPKKEKNPSAPFDIAYEVAMPIYDESGKFISEWEDKQASQFYIMENVLYSKNDLLLSSEKDSWIELGTLEEIELTKGNFNHYLDHTRSKWTGFHSAMELRWNNEKAWRVLCRQQEDEIWNCYMYYVLLQKDGSVYVGRGTYDEGEAGDWASDDSTLSFILQLKENEQTTIQEYQNQIAKLEIEAQKYQLEIELEIEDVVQQYKVEIEILEVLKSLEQVQKELMEKQKN